MEQMDLFSMQDEKLRETEKEKLFRQWQSLPNELVILSGDPKRREVRSMLATRYCFLWRQALHRCPGLPEGKYIWMNCIERPEYWVMNDIGNPAGEHIETCPYCGADLKNGAVDVVLVKADGGWWAVNGFLKGDGTNV